MKEINLLELFSGIGGFTKGFEQAGYTIKEHFFAEIDKHAVANYKYNYPHAKHLKSVTDVYGRDLPNIDVITFGSPCQDFSLAGKQLGMEGERSVLILEAIRIIRECRPSVFIWENVKGVFSSNNGADFWAVLAAFANIGGYRLEWQLLNTSWWLPQNRERIYLIGHKKNCSTGSVFPINQKLKIPNEYDIDKMYQLSEGITNDIRLFPKMEQGETWTKTDMQKLLSRIQYEIQNEKSCEITRAGEEVRCNTEGDIQKIEVTRTGEKEQGDEIFCTSQGIDKSGEFYKVVSIPDERMLVLWDKRRGTELVFGCVQQQNEQVINRQDGFYEALRRGELSTCLLAVQSHKGQLFYSLGNGENWKNVYIKKMELWQQNLNSILQTEVSAEYFLSQKAIDGLMKGQQTPQLLDA